MNCKYIMYVGLVKFMFISISMYLIVWTHKDWRLPPPIHPRRAAEFKFDFCKTSCLWQQKQSTTSDQSTTRQCDPASNEPVVLLSQCSLSVRWKSACCPVSPFHSQVLLESIFRWADWPVVGHGVKIVAWGQPTVDTAKQRLETWQQTINNL